MYCAPPCGRATFRAGKCRRCYWEARIEDGTAPECVTPGCDAVATKAKGMCPGCYDRTQKADPARPRCCEPGCEDPVRSCDRCNRCYQRWLKWRADEAAKALLTKDDSSGGPRWGMAARLVGPWEDETSTVAIPLVR